MILAMAMVMGLALNAQTKEKKVADKPVVAKVEPKASLTPEERAEIRLKRFTSELSLTEKQQKEIKPTLLSIENDRQANIEENKANRKAGTKLTEEEKDKRKIKALEQKITLDKEFKKILNAEQLKKYEERKEEKKENLKKNKQTEVAPAQK